MKNYGLFIIFILSLPVLSLSQEMSPIEEYESSICSKTYSECVVGCSPNTFHNSKYRFTTVKKKCEQACKQGEISCNLAPELDKCTQFEKNCKDNCSGRFYDHHRGMEYDYNQPVKNACDKACTAGADTCELK